MRLEGGRLAAHLEEQLPDYAFAFQGGSEGAAGEVGEWVGGWVRGWVNGRVADASGTLDLAVNIASAQLRCSTTLMCFLLSANSGLKLCWAHV
jgi:hypothetical protein